MITNAPPRDITEKYLDVLVAIAVHFGDAEKQQWFTQALQRIKNDILTEEEKNNLMLHVL